MLLTVLWLLTAHAAPCPPGDSDGDSVPNAVEDLNGDGDCDNDDFDGDGTPNYLDIDDDNDGIETVVEGSADFECVGGPDGVPNYLDDDSDGDGISDADEGTGDADGDFIPNFLDCSFDGLTGDLDLDGLLNGEESSVGTFIDNPDTDDDGILDGVEVVDPLNATDTDSDGVPDALDFDDDNDLFTTREETGWTCPNGQDFDIRFEAASNSWLPTCSNGTTLTTPPRDTDLDGLPDYIDDDDDGDGLLSLDEGDGDLDSDGLPNWLDADDQDGPTGDEDGDGILNQDDTNSTTTPTTETTTGGSTTGTYPQGGGDVEVVEIGGSDGKTGCAYATGAGPVGIWFVLLPLLGLRRR